MSIKHFLGAFLFLVVAATWPLTGAAASHGSAVACQSIQGSPPTFTLDGSYYCVSNANGVSWNWLQQTYGGGNNTFGAAGQTHSQTMTVNTATWPNGTSWVWNWPNPASCCHVDSYYEILYGGAGFFQSPQAPFPIQLKNIHTLTATINVAYTDNGGTVCSNLLNNNPAWTSNIDIIFDPFLFGDPNPFVTYAPLFEFEIALHPGPPQSPTTYTVAENGRTWNAVVYPGTLPSWNVIWLSTGSDVLTGTIDLLAIMKSAITQGYATGNEWFMGVPLGSEVWCGSGGLTINSLSYTFN
jgi:hypothetical protein